MDNKEKVLPKYCRKCGEKLVRKDGEPFFDTQTGEEVVIARLLCPMKDINAFLKKNKIEKDKNGTWSSITDKQQQLIDKFWKNSNGHTNRRYKLLKQ